MPQWENQSHLFCTNRWVTNSPVSYIWSIAWISSIRRAGNENNKQKLRTFLNFPCSQILKAQENSQRLKFTLETQGLVIKEHNARDTRDARVDRINN